MYGIVNSYDNCNNFNETSQIDWVLAARTSILDKDVSAESVLIPPPIQLSGSMK